MDKDLELRDRAYPLHVGDVFFYKGKYMEVVKNCDLYDSYKEVSQEKVKDLRDRGVYIPNAGDDLLNCDFPHHRNKSYYVISREPYRVVRENFKEFINLYYDGRQKLLVPDKRELNNIPMEYQIWYNDYGKWEVAPLCDKSQEMLSPHLAQKYLFYQGHKSRVRAWVVETSYHRRFLCVQEMSDKGYSERVYVM